MSIQELIESTNNMVKEMNRFEKESIIRNQEIKIKIYANQTRTARSDKERA